MRSLERVAIVKRVVSVKLFITRVTKEADAQARIETRTKRKDRQALTCLRRARAGVWVRIIEVGLGRGKSWTTDNGGQTGETAHEPV